MNTALVRCISAGLLVLAVAACSSSGRSPPPSAPTTDVNPITGSRGGSGAR